ncbi:MAG: hypothetical protein U0R50_11770 [Gaiellales bacterium]
MDISKLSTGGKLALGGTVLFLISSFFNWQEVEFANIASAGVSMWHGWGTLAGIIALALLAWEVSKLMGIKISLPITPGMTSAFLGIALVLFTVLKFLVDGEFRTFWAWLGLLFSIVAAAGAVMSMQEGGQSLADMKSAVASGAAAASAAAKSAAESAQSSASSAADSAKEAAGDAADAAKETASDVVETVKDAVDGDAEGEGGSTTT